MWSVRVPYLLSLIATMDPHGTVQGINNVERAYAKKYGPGDYRPDVPVTYWSFRLMIGFGMLAALFALLGLWLTRRAPDPAQPLVLPGRDRRGGATVPGQHDGLDLHRDGPPAVDGVRRAADLAERVRPVSRRAPC